MSRNTKEFCSTALCNTVSHEIIYFIWTPLATFHNSCMPNNEFWPSLVPHKEDFIIKRETRQECLDASQMSRYHTCFQILNLNRRWSIIDVEKSNPRFFFTYMYTPVSDMLPKTVEGNKSDLVSNVNAA